MTRYEGTSLGAGTRVAIVANDAIGNFAVATPLLQVLHDRGCRCDLLSGPRIREFAQLSPWIEASVDVMGSPMAEAWHDLPLGRYGLVMNLEHAPWAMVVCGALAEGGALAAGPCAGPEGRGELSYPDDARGDLWRDREWATANLKDRYPFLETGHISELFVRLLYLEGPIPGYSFPSSEPKLPLPPALVALSASLPSKLWPIEHWIEMCRALASKHGSVGLVGAARKAQGQFYRGASDEDRLVEDAGVVDLRGRLTLPEVVGALASAAQVVTLDNGILHLAAAGPAPVVGLFRPGIVHLWCPRRPGLEALVPGAGGAVADIRVEEVMRACGL